MQWGNKTSPRYVPVLAQYSSDLLLGGSSSHVSLVHSERRKRC